MTAKNSVSLVSPYILNQCGKDFEGKYPTKSQEIATGLGDLVDGVCVK